MHECRVFWTEQWSFRQYVSRVELVDEADIGSFRFRVSDACQRDIHAEVAIIVECAIPDEHPSSIVTVLKQVLAAGNVVDVVLVCR